LVGHLQGAVPKLQTVPPEYLQHSEAIDEITFADQADLIEFFGGRDATLTFGLSGTTPPPKV
jgi:hypothetical protein